MSASAASASRELICNLLIARGLITREKMGEALRIQAKEPGMLVGAILQEMGYVTEAEIIETVLLKYNIPYLSPENYEANHGILAKVDRAFLLANHIFPLDRVGDILSVITINPFNRQAFGELEKIFACAVRPFLGSVSEIRDAIARHYG